MFENRSRRKKRTTFLLIIAFILVSAFGFGFYLNYGGNANVDKDNTSKDDPKGLQIPSSLRNPGAGVLIPNADTIPDKDQSANANPDNLITPTTKIIFKTYFTLCSHMVDKEPEDMKEFINLSEEGLKSKFSEWEINEFSTQQVILKREKQTYCPRHFIIGSKDGYIAIYAYNSDGVKTLYEMTDDPISILTTEDQKNLEYGIVADSEEELQQKLEGLSD
jgi:hypothetical protein